MRYSSHSDGDMRGALLPPRVSLASLQERRWRAAHPTRMVTALALLSLWPLPSLQERRWRGLLPGVPTRLQPRRLPARPHTLL